MSAASAPPGAVAAAEVARRMTRYALAGRRFREGPVGELLRRVILAAPAEQQPALRRGAVAAGLRPIPNDADATLLRDTARRAFGDTPAQRRHARIPAQHWAPAEVERVRRLVHGAPAHRVHALAGRLEHDPALLVLAVRHEVLAASSAERARIAALCQTEPRLAAWCIAAALLLVEPDVAACRRVELLLEPPSSTRWGIHLVGAWLLHAVEPDAVAELGFGQQPLEQDQVDFLSALAWSLDSERRAALAHALMPRLAQPDALGYWTTESLVLLALLQPELAGRCAVLPPLHRNLHEHPDLLGCRYGIELSKAEQEAVIRLNRWEVWDDSWWRENDEWSFARVRISGEGFADVEVDIGELSARADVTAGMLVRVLREAGFRVEEVAPSDSVDDPSQVGRDALVAMLAGTRCPAVRQRVARELARREPGRLADAPRVPPEAIDALAGANPPAALWLALPIDWNLHGSVTLERWAAHALGLVHSAPLHTWLKLFRTKLSREAVLMVQDPGRALLRALVERALAEPRDHYVNLELELHILASIALHTNYTPGERQLAVRALEDLARHDPRGRLRGLRWSALAVRGGVAGGVLARDGAGIG